MSFDTPWWGDSSWVYDGVVTSLNYDKDTRSLYVAGAFDRVNGEAPCQSIAVSAVHNLPFHAVRVCWCLLSVCVVVGCPPPDDTEEKHCCVFPRRAGRG